MSRPAPIVRLATVLLLLVMMQGCVTRRPIVGRDIPLERVEAIEPGATTDKDLVEAFGPPDAVLHYPDESQEYRYSYTGWKDRKTSFLLFSRTRTEKEHKNLFVRLHAGVVTGVSYQDALNPQKSFSR